MQVLSIVAVIALGTSAVDGLKMIGAEGLRLQDGPEERSTPNTLRVLNITWNVEENYPTESMLQQLVQGRMKQQLSETAPTQHNVDEVKPEVIVFNFQEAVSLGIWRKLNPLRIFSSLPTYMEAQGDHQFDFKYSETIPLGQYTLKPELKQQMTGVLSLILVHNDVKDKIKAFAPVYKGQRRRFMWGKSWQSGAKGGVGLRFEYTQPGTQTSHKFCAINVHLPAHDGSANATARKYVLQRVFKYFIPAWLVQWKKFSKARSFDDLNRKLPHQWVCDTLLLSGDTNIRQRKVTELDSADKQKLTELDSTEIEDKDILKKAFTKKRLEKAKAIREAVLNQTENIVSLVEDFRKYEETSLVSLDGKMSLQLTNHGSQKIGDAWTKILRNKSFTTSLLARLDRSEAIRQAAGLYNKQDAILMKEETIKFAPSYKKNKKDTNGDYKTTHVPSYTDRVFYLGEALSNLDYGSLNNFVGEGTESEVISDHNAVFLGMEIQI